jgi:uncharacterized protein (TIGR03437 family)
LRQDQLSKIYRNTIPMRLLHMIALLTALASEGLSQHPTGSLLVIQVENQTGYVRDVFDTTRLAVDRGPTMPFTIGGQSPSFTDLIFIGDIVSVNGRRVKGTATELITWIPIRPNPTTGQFIGDTTRGGFYEWNFEILHEDGRQIGSIRASGMGQGQPPPGATSAVTAANHAVIGGTGAFLGVRGYMGGAGQLGGAFGQIPVRIASVTEDPANRRLHGGGTVRQSVYLLPMFRPEIVSTSSGHAVVHSADFTLVTAAKPARSGEILSLFASGLGPTVPGVEPGEAFSSAARHIVNSPVEVLVNGKPGEVLYAGGYPGAVDRYQVNFRVPDGTTAGLASVQLSSAWIAGPEVTIPVQ